MTTYRLNSGQPLQPMLDNLRGGDVLELEAGAVWSGGFLLPQNRTTQPITIRTTYTGWESSVRVGPADAPKMATLEVPGSSPVLRAQANSHGFVLEGLELRVAADYTNMQYNLLSWGYHRDANTQISVLEELPANIIIKHCYVHGHATSSSRRGTVLNCNGATVEDCYFADFHQAGFDSQAIGCWNSPGNLVIRNCYLEGAGENVLFGGGGAGLGAEGNPDGILIERCHFRKPLHWFKCEAEWDGREPLWTIKNLLEFKVGSNIVVRSNVLENNWAHAQHGQAIVITPREGPIGDILIEDNIILHSAAVAAIADTGPGIGNVTWRNNLVYDIRRGQTNNGTSRGQNYSFNIAGRRDGTRIPSVAMVGNTFAHGWENANLMGTNPSENHSQGFINFTRNSVAQFTCRDNIIALGNYGLMLDAGGGGVAALDGGCDEYNYGHNVTIAENPQSSYPAINDDIALPITTPLAEVFQEPEVWNMRPVQQYAGYGCNADRLYNLAEQVRLGKFDMPQATYRCTATWTPGTGADAQLIQWFIDSVMIHNMSLDAGATQDIRQIPADPGQVIRVQVAGENQHGAAEWRTVSVTVPNNGTPPTPVSGLTLSIEKIT